jgi:soluble lytic murein transglycosylase-like protein
MNLLTILAALSLGAMAHEPGAEVKYRGFLVRQVRFYWGAEQEVSTFAAQIKQESGWDPSARSAYAAGLAQFTPPTAQWLSSLHPEIDGQSPFSASSPYDWKWSIRALVCYDRHLHEKLADAGEQRWRLTLRAYNGGIGWVLKEKTACQQMDEPCCRKFRAPSSCRENISYPVMILHRWKPLYERWDR